MDLRALIEALQGLHYLNWRIGFGLNYFEIQEDFKGLGLLGGI